MSFFIAAPLYQLLALKLLARSENFPLKANSKRHIIDLTVDVSFLDALLFYSDGGREGLASSFLFLVGSPRGESV